MTNLKIYLYARNSKNQNDAIQKLIILKPFKFHTAAFRRLLRHQRQQFSEPVRRLFHQREHTVQRLAL